MNHKNPQDWNALIVKKDQSVFFNPDNGVTWLAKKKNDNQICQGAIQDSGTETMFLFLNHQGKLSTD